MLSAAERALGRWWQARRGRDQLLLMLALGAEAALGQAPFSLPMFSLLGFALTFAFFSAMQSPREAFWSGLAFGSGYFAVALHWIVQPFLVDVARHGWMAPFALVLMAVGLALFWGAAFGVARWAGRSAWVLVPLIALAELGRAYLFTGFPWAMPAYGLVDGLGGQAAAWIGPHGLNLLFLAIAVTLAMGLARPAVGVAGIIVASVALWPVPQAQDAPPDAPILRLVQPNAPQHLKWHPDHVWKHFGRAIEATRAGDERPDLIIWPETSVPVRLSDARNTLSVIASAARGVPVVLGMNRTSGRRIYNSAVVLDEKGVVAGVYDKHHLVPFGEYVPFGDMMARIGIHGLAARDGAGYSAGPGPQLLDLGAVGKALPLICYEVVFPQDVRGTSERPGLLMQITNDAWFGTFSGPYQHLQQARMRAIEMGLPLVRAANTGISAVIDARGRVIAQLGLNEAGYVDAALPGVRTQTIYARTGDFPLAAIMALLIALTLWRRRGKSD
ncbi:MAG: apolipoprotein N-acyltransferase [Rhodobacteraceae bacterium]|nr:apolipoprotein N-acyltransferase [Paracoccaceae bacterium]